jgi:hypothetical protein
MEWTIEGPTECGFTVTVAGIIVAMRDQLTLEGLCDFSAH